MIGSPGSHDQARSPSLLAGTPVPSRRNLSQLAENAHAARLALARVRASSSPIRLFQGTHVALRCREAAGRADLPRVASGSPAGRRRFAIPVTEDDAEPDPFAVVRLLAALSYAGRFALVSPVEPTRVRRHHSAGSHGQKGRQPGETEAEDHDRRGSAARGRAQSVGAGAREPASPAVTLRHFPARPAAVVPTSAAVCPMYRG
jgi:hypothetical protein